ncbi:hypothetical protein BpHYR1_031288 [Brachionus plicatilis]|uniref:Uncharacterized protein n=1 Tax=Brachionus plicatilis TaxID=10195 RepID=A0A3M7T1G1_BRAPC|nr:hypothetical protein BpHYR1_031288 [Brachionus plicatilis]
MRIIKHTKDAYSQKIAIFEIYVENESFKIDLNCELVFLNHKLNSHHASSATPLNNISPQNKP